MKKIRKNQTCITSVTSTHAHAVLVHSAPVSPAPVPAEYGAANIPYTVRRYIVPGVPARLAPPATWDNAHIIRLYIPALCAAPVPAPVPAARRTDGGLISVYYVAYIDDIADAARTQTDADRRARAKKRRLPAPIDPNGSVSTTPTYIDPLDTRDALINAVNRIATSLYRYFANKDGRPESYMLWYSMLSPYADDDRIPDGVSYASHGIIAAMEWGMQYGYTASQVGHILRRAAEHGAHRTPVQRAIRAAIARAIRRDKGVRTQTARAAYARKTTCDVAPCTVTRPDGTTYTIPGYSDTTVEQGHVVGLESYDPAADARISPAAEADIISSDVAVWLINKLAGINPLYPRLIESRMSGHTWMMTGKRLFPASSKSAGIKAAQRLLAKMQRDVLILVSDDPRPAVTCTNPDRAARFAARDREYAAATDARATADRIHVAIIALAKNH